MRSRRRLCSAALAACCWRSQARSWSTPPPAPPATRSTALPAQRTISTVRRRSLRRRVRGSVRPTPAAPAHVRRTARSRLNGAASRPATAPSTSTPAPTSPPGRRTTTLAFRRAMTRTAIEFGATARSGGRSQPVAWVAMALKGRREHKRTSTRTKAVPCTARRRSGPRYISPSSRITTASLSQATHSALNSSPPTTFSTCLQPCLGPHRVRPAESFSSTRTGASPLSTHLRTTTAFCLGVAARGCRDPVCTDAFQSIRL